jgi:hypothetical protein
VASEWWAHFSGRLPAVNDQTAPPALLHPLLRRKPAGRHARTQPVSDDFLLLPPFPLTSPPEKTNQKKKASPRDLGEERRGPEDARLLLHDPLRVRRAGRRRAGLPPPRQHRLPGGGRRRRRAPPPRGVRQPQGLREAAQLLPRPRARDPYAPPPLHSRLRILICLLRFLICAIVSSESKGNYLIRNNWVADV